MQIALLQRHLDSRDEELARLYSQVPHVAVLDGVREATDARRRALAGGEESQMESSEVTWPRFPNVVEVLFSKS